MKLYIRCAVTNRATLLGYLLLLFALITIPLVLTDIWVFAWSKSWLIPMVPGVVGFISLLVTVFGLCTYEGYERALKTFSKHGISERYLLVAGPDYCYRVGAEMAAKDFKSLQPTS